MCGLVGLASFAKRGIIMQEFDVFRQLLVAGSLRGTHGTGILAVGDTGKAFAIRAPYDPYSMMYHKDFGSFETFVQKNDVRFLAGHNRFATRGKAIIKNTHPFHHDHIYLMHNGTLDATTKLPKFNSFEVDSDALCHGIAKLGLLGAIAVTTGAWALVFYDRKKRTLNFARNSERPLYIGTNYMKDFWMWGSEVEMLRWICARNKIPAMTFEALPIREWWEIPIDDSKVEKTPIPFPNYSGTSYSGKGYYFPHGNLIDDEADDARLAIIADEIVQKKDDVLGMAAGSKVVALPPPHVPKATAKILEHKKNSATSLSASGKEVIVLEELFGYRRKAPVSFDMYDAKIESDGDYIVVGGIEDLPSMEIRVRLPVGKEPQKVVDTLMGAPRIKGTVANMTKVTERGIQKYICWVINPEPMSEDEVAVCLKAS